MVFVYGGAFIAGTQMLMGYERLGDAGNDFVLVALNYRLGVLGKFRQGLGKWQASQSTIMFNLKGSCAWTTRTLPATWDS